MAATFRSEDESSRETPSDRRSADENVVQSQTRKAIRGQTSGWRKVTALLLPTFAVCGPSTNRFDRVCLQQLRARPPHYPKPCGRAPILARPSGQNSSREKLE